MRKLHTALYYCLDKHAVFDRRKNYIANPGVFPHIHALRDCNKYRPCDFPNLVHRVLHAPKNGAAKAVFLGDDLLALGYFLKIPVLYVSNVLNNQHHPVAVAIYKVGDPGKQQLHLL